MWVMFPWRVTFVKAYFCMVIKKQRYLYEFYDILLWKDVKYCNTEN